ncbi:MAG: hypothetical protein ACP5JW_02490 [Candidatus Bathyarchaeia archaeon]
MMEQNPVIQTLLSHKSIRKYKADMPPENVIRTIIRGWTAGAFRLSSLQHITVAG